MSFDIPFSGRAHTYTQDELDLIVEVARDAVPLTQGRYLKEFEQAFCEFAGVEHAFAVSNATAALEIAGQLCCFEDGDEVILPSHTYTASAYPFIKRGGTPVWADVDPVTRVVTVETIEKCVTEKTKAIVVVHLYGYCADMPTIMAFAKDRGLLVIEDVAQALGVELEGKAAGTFGDFGIYSFHSHKNVSTLGEGGILTVKDPRYVPLVPMLRHNGHCPFPFERKDYWVPAMGGVDLPMLDGKALLPNNYCLGEVECALGARLLRRIKPMNAEKRARAMKFIDDLSDCPELVFHRVDEERHSYHLLVARIDNRWRDKFIRTMATRESIQCAVQYYPLNRYPLYEKLGYGEANCPAADDFFDNMVSFPFNHLLSDEQLDRILAATRRVILTLRQGGGEGLA